MNKNIIDINNLNFSYNREPVLEKISLEVKKGDFIGLIGPNGSGKSTLLKIILGLLKPNSGEVTLFGTPIAKFKAWIKIGYLAQKAGFNPSGFPITVEEVLNMTGSKKEEIDRVLKLTDISLERKKLLSELSGGQQQRVFIARALLNKPELLILDEPTVGIDSHSQINFYNLLRTLNQENNLTIILVSHEIDVLSKEVDKVACINKNLIYHGHPQKLLEENLIEKLYGKHQRLITHQH